MEIDKKASYAVVNGHHLEIGDFVVVGKDASDGSERIWRVAGVHFTADGCKLNCVVDSRFSSSVGVMPLAVIEVLLESEVELDEQGRFKRCN